jgi:hypothetical protein
MKAQRYCHECGKACHMRYPSNNPENGPARMACPDGHETVRSLVQRIADSQASACFFDLVDEYTQGGPFPDFVVPEDVRSAATVLRAHLVDEDNWLQTLGLENEED